MHNQRIAACQQLEKISRASNLITNNFICRPTFSRRCLSACLCRPSIVFVHPPSWPAIHAFMHLCTPAALCAGLFNRALMHAADYSRPSLSSMHTYLSASVLTSAHQGIRTPTSPSPSLPPSPSMNLSLRPLLPLPGRKCVPAYLWLNACARVPCEAGQLVSRLCLRLCLPVPCLCVYVLAIASLSVSVSLSLSLC